MVSRKVLWVSGSVAVIAVAAVATVLVLIYLPDDPEAIEIHYEETLVETSLGKINGSAFRTRLDKKFIGFRGIRFAEAPVGDLRFRVNNFN